MQGTRRRCGNSAVLALLLLLIPVEAMRHLQVAPLLRFPLSLQLSLFLCFSVFLQLRHLSFQLGETLTERLLLGLHLH